MPQYFFQIRSVDFLFKVYSIVFLLFFAVFLIHRNIDVLLEVKKKNL